MQIKLGNGGKVKVFLSYQDEKLQGGGKIYGLISDKKIFKGEPGEIYSHLSADEDHEIYLGLGKKKDLDYEVVKEAFYKLGKEFIRLRVESGGVDLGDLNNLSSDKLVYVASEGLLRSEYRFDKYLSEKKPSPCLKEFYIDVKGQNLEARIEESSNVVAGIFTARDLVSEPSNVINPTSLGQRAKDILEPLGVVVRVYNKKEIEDLKMEAFLNVSKGSDQEPKLIVMEYLKGDKDDKTLALVGKGLTYDSGGYSLKSSDAMKTMFGDMAGSASVIGAIEAAARSGLKKNVVGIVAACENSVSGKSQKPGDIIGSMSGKTIEVDNTDAEGRLTLADALWYGASVIKADYMVDIATLTYDVQVALSDVASGIISNDKDFSRLVQKAGEECGEKVHEFPIYKEFEERAKSERADLINTGSDRPEADQIVAGVFLREFTNDVPWVHIDLGSRSYLSKDRGYEPKGATGIPTNTLYNIIKLF